MPKSRKTHTPKARPQRPISGEWVSDELPPAVLEHARKIRVYAGRSYRKLSDEALRKIGAAFSMYRQTSAPPPQLDVKQATELRKALGKLVKRIDNIIDNVDDGLALALAVAWQRLRYDGKPYAPPDVPADASQFARNRALMTRVQLPEIEFPPPAPAGSFDRWPAARQWLHVLDAGLREVIESAPAINKGGRPRLTGARDRLLAAVTQALADDGVAEDCAPGHAADILDAAGIKAPTDERRLKTAAKAGVQKPRARRRGLRTEDS